MKKKRLIPIEAILAIITAVLIVIVVQAFPRHHTLQYIEDGELKTETFRSTREFSERALELKEDSIKYWLDLNR